MNNTQEEYIWAGFYREGYNGEPWGFSKDDMKAAVRVKDITPETYESIVGEPYEAKTNTVTPTPTTNPTTTGEQPTVAPTV